MPDRSNYIPVMTPKQYRHNPEVLGQLLLMQSIVGSLPDEETIFSFVCRGLLDVPGVAKVSFTAFTAPDKDDTIVSYPIQTDNSPTRQLTFEISDHTVFEPYMEYVKNFCFMLSVLLGERELRKIIESHKKNLEKRVAVRTAELENEIAIREKAEEALQENEKLFRSTFENASIGICLTLPDDQFLMVNPACAELFGYDIDQLENSSFSDLTHKDDLELSCMHISSLLKNEVSSVKFDKRFIHKSGSIIWATVNSFLLRNKEGYPKFFITHITDITEQKNAEKEKRKLEEQLRQAHKMEAIGTLAGGIAHDFNNLLAIILGFSEIAQDELPENSPSQESIRQVLQAAMRAKELVRQILSFSRKEPKALSATEIGPLAQETLKLLRATIPTTIEIQHSVENNCGRILADPGQISQILLNLCTNAAQAMEENGGILTIKARREEVTISTLDDTNTPWPGSYILLSVSDTGRGIKKNQLERIFEPFFTTKEVGKGSGMGLSVVHGLVKSHNGFIFVESQPGIGTTFNVYFPITEGKSVVQPPPAADTPHGKAWILVVDDEMPVAEMTKRTIQRLGYNAVATTSAIAALEMVKEDPNSFNLIITDQTMPQITGDRLAAELLKLQPDLPVIICSGYSSKFDRPNSDLTGIFAYMTKPLDRGELARNIRAAIDAKS